ncbi:kinase domain protein [Aspergillus californicus]
MDFHVADTLEKHDWVGGGFDAYVYHVTPMIVVKTVRHDRAPGEEAAEHPFLKEIVFYKRLNDCEDQSRHIIECFLMLSDHLFLSYCIYKAIAPRFYERQERERGPNGFHGSLLKVKEYEDPALHVEKLGFCHNDLHASNCLLDENLNLKLADFGRATTIGKLLEGAQYGLCCARTGQFAVGTLLYFMVYGHEPYDEIILDAAVWDRRFGEMEFPELNRHEVFDGLISACWHNVYPTMTLVAYDFKRKTDGFALKAEYTLINSAKEAKTCGALVSKGLLGPELALRFQPVWRGYLCGFMKRGVFVWQYFLRKFWS